MNMKAEIIFWLYFFLLLVTKWLCDFWPIWVLWGSQVTSIPFPIPIFISPSTLALLKTCGLRLQFMWPYATIPFFNSICRMKVLRKTFCCRVVYVLRKIHVVHHDGSFPIIATCTRLFIWSASFSIWSYTSLFGIIAHESNCWYTCIYLHDGTFD